MPTSRRQSQINLERIIDQPLERGKRSNHHDPHGQTIPQAGETNILIYPANRGESALSGFAVRVQLGHHHVRRVTDDRTSDTSDVASQERHSSLLERIELLFRLAERCVDLRDRGLERRELDHRVRNLACPERVQTLVEPAESFVRDDLAPAFAEIVRVWRQSRLHAHLDRLKRAEEDIRDELRRG